MVDDCNVSVGGRDVLKKVMYLTNKQAKLFDEDAMERCIEALDIGSPKFIIKILPSLAVRTQMLKSHQERIGEYVTFFATSPCGSYNLESQYTHNDTRSVQTQILLFMKTVILPLAKQTNALILIGGADDCVLAAALTEIAVAEQARLGTDCPFTVLATVAEHEIHSRAATHTDRSSVSGQISRQSLAWSRRMKDVHRFRIASTANLKGINRKFQRCDLSAAASRIIIFECIDEVDNDLANGVKSIGCKLNFESILLSCLTKKLPSICIQSNGITSGIQYLADLVSRSIPILLIDTYERSFSSAEDQREGNTDLAKASHAFPVVPKTRLSTITFEDDQLTAQGRKELLKIAFEMLEEKWNVMRDMPEYHTAALLAFLHSVLHCVDIDAHANNNLSLHDVIATQEKLEDSNRGDSGAHVPFELVSEAIEFALSGAIKKFNYSCLRHLQQWIEATRGSTAPEAKHIPVAEDSLVMYQRIIDKYEHGEKVDHIHFDFGDDRSSAWLSLFDVLASPIVHSGSFYDIDGLRRKIGRVAKLDRLPEGNSLEVNRTLREAWDCIELWHQVADSYKMVTIITYILLLLTGIAIVIINLIQLTSENVHARIVIMALSAFSTMIVSYVTFINPNVKWEQLRVAALELESNIWMFRTRAGPFRTAGEEFSKKSDDLFYNTMQELKSVVLEAADVRTTAFYSHAKTENLHGQRESSLKSIAGKSTEVVASPGHHFEMHDIYSVNSNTSGVAAGAPDDRMVEGFNNVQEPSVTTELARRFPRFQVAEDLPHYPQWHARHYFDYAADSIRVNQVLQLINNFAGGSIEHPKDRHYEPLQPTMYLRFRVDAAIQFYRKKIPKYNNIRFISQTVVILGSVASGIVAFFNVATWSVLISSVAAAVAAFLQFHGTNKKINRYSATVHALTEMKCWWDSLPSIDRSVVANIDTLILSCENIIRKESESWKSSAAVNRKVSSSGEQEENNGSDAA